MNEQTITLDKFIEELKDKVVKFEKYWKTNQENIETQKWYPNELLKGDWEEQFDAYDPESM